MATPLRYNFRYQAGPRPSDAGHQRVRATYGLTQAWLAHFLQVPRSTLAMHEAGRGQLPTRCGLRLLALELALPPPYGTGTTPPATPTAAGQAATRTALLARQADLDYEVFRLGPPHERLRVQLRQVRQRVHSLPALLAALPPAPDTAVARRYLSHWAEDAPEQLRAAEAVLALAELRERVLAFEQAAIAELLAALPPSEAAGP